MARDVFVNNASGDDRLDGSLPERGDGFSGPVKTIGRALRLATKSSRVVLAKTDEPYRESISLSAANHTGVPDEPFLIVGNGAVLDGTKPIPHKAWEHYFDHVFRYRPYWLGTQSLFIDGEPIVRRPGGVPRKGPPTLTAAEWEASGEWVYFCVGKGRLPYDYAISQAVLPVGITLYHVHDVVIQDLTVQGFRIDGVNINDGVTNCVLDRVTTRRNGRAGIFVGGASDEVYLESCQSAENAEAQLLLRGLSHTIVRDTKLIEAPGAPDVKREERATAVIEPPAKGE
jgi:hypothetical protein